MIVFKTFLKVLNRCKWAVILYTVLLVGFAAFQMQTGDSSMGFTASRPDIVILNRDEESMITRGLVDYMANHCNVSDIKEEGEALSDALFYREVSYVIDIPVHYGEDFLEGKEPELTVRSTGDYHASYAEMLLSRYLKTARAYAAYVEDGQELSDKVAAVLEQEVPVNVTSSLDTKQLSRASFYFNFANYSLLAGCVYVICMILSSFRAENILRRTSVSSMDTKKFNRLLLLSNGLFAFVLWLIYVLLSFLLVGSVMLTPHGLLYIANSFVFAICALTVAFLIGNLVKNKNAVNGIVNVAALGSSFLCGAFVPVELLPSAVLKMAHILPSYWYIQTNERLKDLETIEFEAVKPILFNMGMVLVFALLFWILSNAAARRSMRE